ncbi:hypothetical protein KP509_24G043700 [Ceratopteris richardii]|uniref:F-box domain-containing protein n=1 Tax=Ceratopteris richardii TaxID=49495 RepID=A0A8T2RU68_CERRI|nr:hypothetical protein KP509_24G043700 [Ceratopteris richardii]
MLHISHSCDRETDWGSECSRWSKKAFRWLSHDANLFIWDRLPFSPSNWWISATAMMITANRSSTTILSDYNNHDHNYVGRSNGPSKTTLAICESRNAPEALIHNNTTAESTSFKSELAMGKETGAEGLDREDIQKGKVAGDEVMLQELDGGIWSCLPEDILEKVLAWLPLTSVLRFRVVCRRWNTLLLSESFLSSHSRSSMRRQPCFLLCTIGQFACSYDPSLGKWLTLLKPTSPGASVITSTRSLFCLGNQVAECRVLCVCNPITRRLRRLPPMHKLRLIHKIAMLEDRRTKSYSIVVAGEDALPMPNPHAFRLITEVFDSRSYSWRGAADPPPSATFGSDPGVWFKGAFYCLTELPYGLVRFSLQEGTWEEVRVSMPPFLSVPSLVTTRNRLMMIARCESTRDYPLQGEKDEAATRVRIWELVHLPVKDIISCSNCKGDEDDDDDQQRSHQRDSLSTCSHPTPETRKLDIALDGSPPTDGSCYEWTEVLEMPRSVSQVFLAPLSSYSPFVCAGVGNCIFMTTHLSPNVLVLDLSMVFATQNSSSSSEAPAAAASPSSGISCWSWLPQDPLFPIQRDSHLFGFAFEPRFDAFP